MKVLCVLCDGFAEFEYEIAVLGLESPDVYIDVVGLEGREVEGMKALKATTSRTLSQVTAAEYDALFLPGIDSTRRDRAMRNETLLGLIREFDRAGKLVAAVCGAPAVLGAAGILKGRRFSSDAKDQPAFEGATRVSGPAVRDGNVITGLGGRIFEFTAMLVEAVSGPEQARDVREWAGLPVARPD